MRLPVHLKPQSKMLLCIDDDEDVLECEKGFLESFGYTVLTAPSGGKALELASIHSFDAVILDYFMPEMNGQEVAIEMKRLRPQAPMIMLSGAVEVPDRLASQLLPRNCRNVDRPRGTIRWALNPKREY
jgi:CheY-like chemotaxis protein